MSFRLGLDTLTARRLVTLAARANPDVSVAEETKQKCLRFRADLEKAVASDRKMYGVNTGFGLLANVPIPREQLHQLQLNLIRSHACGVGEILSPTLTRALLVLRAHTFLLGHSAVTWQCIEQILAFLKHDILPVVPCQGSVGASGDLAPLAHLALGIIGEGDVVCDGKRQRSKEVLAAKGLKPFTPGPKEGLSLINGTQFMTVIGAYAITEAFTIADAADVAVGLSLDAIRGSTSAYDERIHAVRPQVGQGEVAKRLLALFSGRDEIVESHKDCDKVQDPYSFRCVPQVHGAVRDTLKFVAEIINRELNAVTDNPLFFSNGDSLSGGNFHGEPVAMAMDFLAIACAELGSISERRTEKMTNPQHSSLPPFVTKNSGLNSGFMIPHVVAAALASENKVLCHPACVDSIPTSADKEDHVSMGPIAARKARKVIEHVGKILAIEMMAASRAIGFLEPLKPAQHLTAVLNEVRKFTPPVDADRPLGEECESVANWIFTGGLTHLLTSRNISEFMQQL